MTNNKPKSFTNYTNIVQIKIEMSINKLYLPILFFCALMLQTACVDQDFDEPPVPNGSNLVANTTIADLKAGYISGNFQEITDDIIIEGIVITSDEAGNFYKELFIQDATGGIGLSINVTNLYNEYPLGRKVFIKCQGLTLGDDNGSIQLGGGITTGNNGDPLLARIEDVLLTDFIEKGPRDQTLPIQTIKISDINEGMVNSLVKLENVQFASIDAGETYADPIQQFSLNRTVEDCDDNQIVLRSSGFSSFAADLTPENGGSITALLSIFRSDYQLLISDITDMNFNIERCSTSTGGGGGGGGGNTGVGEIGDPVNTIDEGFDGAGNNEDIAFEGWINIATQGTRLWRGKEFDDNLYAQATAFQDDSPDMETWLITPPIIMNEAKTLNFETAKSFWVHNGLSVWVSTEFDGDVNTGNWEELEATIAQNSDEDNAWIDSGNIDLSDYVGDNIFIGFKYTGSASGNTSTYRIDNVVVE